ncbi:unnamed protein product [Calypogeia fissa]
MHVGLVCGLRDKVDWSRCRTQEIVIKLQLLKILTKADCGHRNGPHCSNSCEIVAKIVEHLTTVAKGTRLLQGET